MVDPRIPALAEKLVASSIAAEPGERVLIEVFDAPAEVAIALIRAVRARGATPFVQLHDQRVAREMAREAAAPQYDLIGAQMLDWVRKMDCYIAVRGSANITELADVSAESMRLVLGKMKPSLDHRVRDTRWVILRWPTASMAQLAGMSTEGFEDFFFRACMVDFEPLAPAIERLRERLTAADRVHIRGPGTDLQFSIANIGVIASQGGHNIPDGEVFTAPVRDSVYGRIAYNVPAIYQGRAFDGIALEFDAGRIVGVEGSDAAAIDRILDQDDGARFIGEFALGFNPQIREPMRDILFDEKIAGSFHFTPGQAYDDADNGNRSQVHWDLVCIQRSEWGGGEILLDGKLLRKDGVFVDAELAPLNPPEPTS